MTYRGQYAVFDARKIQTFPLSARANKVTLASLISPEQAARSVRSIPLHQEKQIREIAKTVVAARKARRAVIVFTGAHLIKNGLGPVLADLVERGWVTLVAGNGAVAIHDFELAMIGETSENVPNALPKGQFGMAREFGLFNAVLKAGYRQGLGFGESLGRAIRDPVFRRKAGKIRFQHPEVSLLAAAYAKKVPMTILAGIGADVTDQHPSFDGAVKGGVSGRDFLIFTNEVTRLAGGVFLNIGSAVAGPEALLKAVSMAANIGKPPKGLVTADFDLRSFDADEMRDERLPGYYCRDQKSVVTRIPEAFKGRGYYIRGDQKETFPALYRAILKAGESPDTERENCEPRNTRKLFNRELTRITGI